MGGLSGSDHERRGADGAASRLAVRVIVHLDDLEVNAWLRSELAAAGITVVNDGGDVVIAAVSVSAVRSPDWVLAVERCEGQRIVPLRIGAVEPSTMPPAVQQVQWLQYDATNRSALFGRLLASIDSDPALHHQAKQLEGLAAAWARGRYPDGLLLANRHQADEAQALVRVMTSKGHLQPSQLLATFVERSAALARRLQRRRRIRRGIGVGAVVIVGVSMAVLLPALRERVRSNNSLIVLDSTSETGDQLPEWTALLAAASLIHGDPDSVPLAREVLAVQLSTTWALGAIQVGPGFSIEAAMPFDGGERIAVVLHGVDGDRFGIYLIAEQRFEWDVATPFTSWYVELDAREEHAYLVGGDGVVAVDLVARTVANLVDEQPADRVVVLPHQLALASFDGPAAVVDLASGGVTEVGQFGELLNAGPSVIDGRPGALALYSDVDAERYLLVDLVTGETLASTSSEGVAIPAGGVLPDETAAAVVDAEHQLSILRADGTTTPTGLAVADLTQLIVGLGDDRVAYGGQVEHVTVADVSLGVRLGTVCQMPQDSYVLASSNDAGTIVCLGGVLEEAWSVPLGPKRGETGPWRSTPKDRRGGTVATIEDGGVVVTVEATGDTARLTGVVAGTVTALAVSDDGRNVLVGGSTGEVAMLTVHEARVLLRSLTWSTPTGSPVVGLDWRPGPVVLADDELAWTIETWCTGCATDAGMIQLVIERTPPCWSDLQLTNVELDTRRQLEVSDCAGVSRGLGE